MDEREKESQVEERSEVTTEEGTERREEEEIQEGPAIGEAVAEEEERCEEDPEGHSSAKRARVCATFTDSQEVSIVEFVKLHPELYDKEHSRFHNRTRREALWAEISAELNLQPFDVRRWFESQRTRYGKLSKLQSGQAPREMTKRQSWVYQQMGFLKTHIRRKGANRSSGFEASPNTSRQDESRGSTNDTEHLESSVLRERSQSIITSTPVSTTDSKILEHFEQMRTLISGFLHQKSDRQPFFDYVASEAEKMTQEKFEELKGKIFRDIETIKSNRRRQPLPRRSATVTTESQRVGLLPTTTPQASSSTQAAASSSFVYYTPSPIGFICPYCTGRREQTQSEWNLKPATRSDINTDHRAASAAAATAAAVLYYHHFSTASTAAAASSVAIQSGRVFGLPGPFQGHQIFQKQLFSYMLFQFPSQNKKVQYKYLSQEKKFKSNTYTTPNMKQITHGTTHNKKGHIKKLKIILNMAINQIIFRLKSMG